MFISSPHLRLGIGIILFGTLCLSSPLLAMGQRGIADILSDFDALDTPADRRAAAEAIRTWQQEQREAAVQRAAELNLPIRRELPDGTVKELTGLDAEGRLLYFATHNDAAAISTGANLLHREPHFLDGRDLVIGMWDGGAGRNTHREFEGGRMVIRDGAAPIAHATHVGGTLAAAGITARAQGMAFAARVDSYDWNEDKAEMTARAATGPGDPEALLLSNHSYGIISGWFRTGGSDPAFIWYGSGSTASSFEPRFGQYNTYPRDSDAIAYQAPYYLMFRSAGNDRTDNPAPGQFVQLSPSSTTTVAYDPAVHPSGDGVYRGGYDTISFDAVAKNVITIGSVSDAVSAGRRDPGQARVSNFSAWGPTDDGRIKPDLVANGEGVYSTLNSGDASYGTLSGTSMSAPNAAGTAALLTEKYARLFPGGAMRASTLKGLLIHTADDLGAPGPDFQYGWGLLNGGAAADLIADHAAHPERMRMQEDVLTPSQPSRSHPFVWDGTTPIRATLSWTDPPGTATTSADLRSPRLRNNLDLRIVGPDDTVYLPYVMPFVGTWTVESMSAPATHGVNNTDNVEQVDLPFLPMAGVYVVTVSHQGSLTDNRQVFSLLLDGASGDEPPPPPLRILSVSPTSAFAGGIATLAVDGSALETATDLRLTRMGQGDIPAGNLRMEGETLLGEVNLDGAAPGAWNVEINNETESDLLAEAFTIRAALWAENFDGDVSGWSSAVLNNRGNNAWMLSDAAAHTPPSAYFAAGPGSLSDTVLLSPVIAIPPAVENLQLHFHHDYNLENRRDGGRLEYQLEGGNWIGVGEDNSGTQFSSRGYTASIQGIGAPASRSTFAGKQAWTGNSGGFVQTIVNLFDTPRFAGSHLRFRWYLATDNSNASPGWSIDSVVLLGDSEELSQPPEILEAITVVGAEPILEEGQTIHQVSAGLAPLHVTAADAGGQVLTYIWSATGPAPVFFIPDGTADAHHTTAYFEALGDYLIQVIVANEEGLSTSDSTLIRILPTPTAIQIDPGSATLRVAEEIRFIATLLDQFNDPMPEQPEAFDWSTTGGGQVDADGRFLATTVGENFSIMASVDRFSGTITLLTSEKEPSEIGNFAQVTVLPGLAVVSLTDIKALYDGTPKTVGVETIPGDLEVRVTYHDSETPPSRPGEYPVVATVTDGNYEGMTTGVFTIAYDRQAYDEWIAGFGLSGEAAEPHADPDGSGLSNLYKWRFDFDPIDPSAALRIGLILEEARIYLTVNRVIPEGTFTVIRSGNLLAERTLEGGFVSATREDDFRIEIDPEPPIGYMQIQFRLDYTGF